MLKISRVTRRFGAKTAVDDVSLDIPAGQVAQQAGQLGVEVGGFIKAVRSA